MIDSFSTQSNLNLYARWPFKGREDLQGLRHCYEAGMSPIPAYGILTDAYGPGEHVCACRDCGTGRNAGKHPLVKWGWMSRLSSPVRWSQVEEWISRFDRVDQPINWAYHFRASGLIGLDLDPRNGRFDLWEELIARNGGLPRTPKDSVRGRGYHLWFRCPDESLLPPSTHLYLTDEMSVELKWGNNYFFGPPSVHRCGYSYAWEPGLAPWETSFAPLPTWLLDLAWEVHEKTHRKLAHAVGDPSDTPAQRTQRQTPTGFLPLDVDYIPNGYRNRSLFTLACRFRAWGWDETEIVNALLDVNRLRCSPAAPDAHVVAIAVRVAQRYPAGPSEGCDPWNSDLTPELRAAHIEFVRPGSKGERQQQHIVEVKAFEPLRVPADQVPLDELRARRLREEAVADEIAAMRYSPQFPCRQPYCIFLTKPGVSRLFEKRCEKWGCPGCARVHREEWSANIRFRLQLEEGPLYVLECTRSDWVRRIGAAVRRAGGEHFKLQLADHDDENLNSEPFLIVTNANLGERYGCRPISREEAAVALVAGLDRFGIESKPIHASTGWQLPKREEQKTGEWERLGMIPRRCAADEIINDIADAHGVRVEEQATRDGRTPPTILRVRNLRHPPAWTRGDVEHLYFQCLMGSVIDKGERVQDGEIWTKTGPATFEIRYQYETGGDADADDIAAYGTADDDT